MDWEARWEGKPVFNNRLSRPFPLYTRLSFQRWWIALCGFYKSTHSQWQNPTANKLIHKQQLLTSCLLIFLPYNPDSSGSKCHSSLCDVCFYFTYSNAGHPDAVAASLKTEFYLLSQQGKGPSFMHSRYNFELEYTLEHLLTDTRVMEGRTDRAVNGY